MAQTVENPPIMVDTWGRSLGWEDPLEEDMATHSSVLAWKIPWTEEPGGLQSRDRKESDTKNSIVVQVLFYFGEIKTPCHFIYYRDVCVCMCIYAYGHNLNTVSYN